MRNRNRAVRRAVVEAMEDRRLLSVSIPANYVKVETIDVDAKTSGDQGFSAELTAGAAYYVVSGKPDGSGGYTPGSIYGNTAGIGTTSSGAKRRTDALKFDATTESGVYSNLTAGNAGRFTFSGVADGDGDGSMMWGGVYQSDHIYGQKVVATGSHFGVVFRDTPLTDNSGYMTLELWKALPEVDIVLLDDGTEESGVAPVRFQVTRSGDLSESLTVYYQVNDVDTSGADDYETPNGFVTFSPGSATATIEILPVDDGLAEYDEVLEVELLPEIGGTYLLADAPLLTRASGTILENDIPTIAIEVTDSAAAEEDEDPAEVTFVREGNLASEVTVYYSVGGSATIGSAGVGDFYGPADAGSGLYSITIPEGVERVSLAIRPNDDPEKEDEEDVAITIEPDTESSAPSYIIGEAGSESVSIEDNDATPVVSITAVDDRAIEGSLDDAAFEVTRTGDLTAELTVVLAVTGATPDDDFTLSTGHSIDPGTSEVTTVVVFAANQQTQVITLDAAADNQAEGDEQVTLAILPDDPESENPESYVVGSPADATATIAEDHYVDLVVDGLPEETQAEPHELDPGAVIFLNDDFDESEGIEPVTPDHLKSGVLASDDELVDGSVSFGGDYSSATWSLDFPSSYVKVYSVESGMLTEMASGSQGSVPSSGRVDLKIEGIATALGLVILAQVTKPSTSPSADEVAALVAKSDLDALKMNGSTAGEELPDNRESGDGGAFVPVNDDDDDYSIVGAGTGADMAQKANGGLVVGENDLLPIVVHPVAGLPGKYALHYDSIRLQVYRHSDRTIPLDSDAVFDIPAETDLPLFVEAKGIAPPEATQAGGIAVALNWISPANKRKEVDTITVRPFKWFGPLNVPEQAIYRYVVGTTAGAKVVGRAAAVGAGWIEPTGGSIHSMAVEGPSDAKILWGAGPTPGKARYKVNDDYTWNLDVNVVEIVVDQPAFARGQPFDGGAAKELDVFSGNPDGMTWSARVAANGPAGNRGIAQMDIGFVQNVHVQTLNTVYQGANHRRKVSFEGGTFLDRANDADARFAFYSSRAAAKFTPAIPTVAKPNANVSSIAASDRPKISPPVTWRKNFDVGEDVTQLNLQYNFKLDVVARTTDLRTDASKEYPIQATANWSWNGTNDPNGIGNRAGGFVWTRAANGITIPQVWAVPQNPGTTPEHTTGPTANQMIDKDPWPVS